MPMEKLVQINVTVSCIEIDNFDTVFELSYVYDPNAGEEHIIHESLLGSSKLARLKIKEHLGEHDEKYGHLRVSNAVENSLNIAMRGFEEIQNGMKAVRRVASDCDEAPNYACVITAKAIEPEKKGFFSSIFNMFRRGTSK